VAGTDFCRKKPSSDDMHYTIVNLVAALIMIVNICKFGDILGDG